MKDNIKSNRPPKITDKLPTHNAYINNRFLRYMSYGIFLLLLGMILNACGKENRGKGCECYASNPSSSGLAAATVTVSPSNLEDEYSTYEHSGEFHADAACHAEMSLAFRWADDNLAKSDIRPPLTYEFQTVFGYFPTNPNMEVLNTLSDGVHEYRIVISEAEDASTPEGTSYGIWVKYLEDYTTQNGAITCRIEIDYGIYNQAFWEEGCDL